MQKLSNEETNQVAGGGSGDEKGAEPRQVEDTPTTQASGDDKGPGPKGPQSTVKQVDWECLVGVKTSANIEVFRYLGFEKRLLINI